MYIHNQGLKLAIALLSGQLFLTSDLYVSEKDDRLKLYINT